MLFPNIALWHSDLKARNDKSRDNELISCKTNQEKERVTDDFVYDSNPSITIVGTVRCTRRMNANRCLTHPWENEDCSSIRNWMVHLRTSSWDLCSSEWVSTTCTVICNWRCYLYELNVFMIRQLRWVKKWCIECGLTLWFELVQRCSGVGLQLH